MLSQEIKDFLDVQKLGYVATVSSDGKPNISPKGTIIVWTSEVLAFADIRSPDTIKNLQNNPHVEINVIDPILRKGSIYFKARLELLRIILNLKRFSLIIEQKESRAQSILLY